jgi:hypothetical protein
MLTIIFFVRNFCDAKFSIFLPKSLGVFLEVYIILQMTDNFTPKNAQKFCCEKCDFICSKNSDLERHLLTRKHKNTYKLHKNTDAESAENANVTNNFICECGKEYKHRQSLWNHKQKCGTNNFVYEPLTNEPLTNIMDKDELIKYLMKENSEFKDMLVEQNKMVMKICEKSLDTSKTINNTNTNCNNINNSFNLNLFLNEKCKDAINISDFVDNIKLQLTDLENFGQMGYIEGVSRILVKNLKNLDAYSRPIHCSDLKREVFYIKDNNEWAKDTDDKTLLKGAIKQVANKNIKQIPIWKQNNPGCCESESNKNDQYMNIVMNSMSGGSNEEQFTNISQIVKNVAKAVVIDKV